MSARERFVDVALGEVGKPYRLHRDCSGYTAWAARQVGITIPEGSVAQFSVGTRAPMSPGSPYFPDEPGLLHFWDTYDEAPGHVGIGIGGGKFVHAMNDQAGITVSHLGDNMGGRNRYMGARDIFTEGAPDPSGPIGKPDGVAGRPDGERDSDSRPSTTKPRRESSERQTRHKADERPRRRREQRHRAR